uniref:N-alpha-acetyltransferase 40, NatD catalytic subunit n=1 Tax=Scleropages formosus TaxID=113540 RepID=A0A8C9T204_SCLFO
LGDEMKSDKARTKKQKRLMKQAARDAVFAKVEAASKIEDPLAFFPLFKKYDRNGTEMRKVIVPVFRQNTGAYRFFREALQFDIDVYSPSTFSTYGNSSIHEILSRQTKFGEAVGLACYGDPCYCCD